MDDWLAGWLAGWMDGWMAGWMDGWMDGWTHRMDGWMTGWLAGWVQRTDGWRMDEMREYLILLPRSKQEAVERPILRLLHHNGGRTGAVSQNLLSGMRKSRPWQPARAPKTRCL